MSGTHLPGPDLDVEFAIGVGRADLAGAWDAGTWDSTVWGQPDTALGDWVDITCYTLDGLTVSAGASGADGVVTRWEAATVALSVVGAVFDPRSGPWAGLLGPGTPLRVRWRPASSPDWLTAFGGFVDDDGFTYDPKTRRATIAGTDGTRVLNAFDGLEQPAAGQGETAAQRVERILDLAGWPVQLRDVEAGGVAMQSTTLAGNAWSMLLAVADSDLGLLWVNRAGQLAYRPQGKVKPREAVAVVIGCHVEDDGGQLVVVEPVQLAGQQPTITRNVVSISRQSSDTDEAATVTVRDERSISRYLTHTYARTDLQHLDDAWSSRIAGAVLVTSAWPSTAPESAELDTRADLAAGPLLLGLEPSMSVYVDDGSTRWLVEPVGWSTEIWRNRVAGVVHLADVSTWVNVGWDTATWDADEWGF
jgi:hypothetical protein